MLPHSDTLSWFRANQSLLFLLNVTCLTEKQHTSICIVFWFVFWLCRLKAQQNLCLYVVFTMPTLNKTYLLFIYISHRGSNPRSIAHYEEEAMIKYYWFVFKLFIFQICYKMTAIIHDLTLSDLSIKYKIKFEIRSH